VNFVVTVMADQDALLELAPKRFATAAMAAGEIETLRVRIAVMKAERSQASVVATNLAAPTHCGDHLSLEIHAFDTAVRPARVARALRVTLASVVRVSATAGFATTHDQRLKPPRTTPFRRTYVPIKISRAPDGASVSKIARGGASQRVRLTAMVFDLTTALVSREASA